MALVAYLPLASGRLTRPTEAKETEALRLLLAEIAQAHDASVSQVALNWLVMRDPHVIAIPSATKPHHVEGNLNTLTWRLSASEFDAIDRASAPRKA